MIDYDKTYRNFVKARSVPMIKSTRDANAKRRKLRAAGYDVHHVRPKSDGGSDKKSNTVFMKHGDHQMAHFILMMAALVNGRRTNANSVGTRMITGAGMTMATEWNPTTKIRVSVVEVESGLTRDMTLLGAVKLYMEKLGLDWKTAKLSTRNIMTWRMVYRCLLRRKKQCGMKMTVKANNLKTNGIIEA